MKYVKDYCSGRHQLNTKCIFICRHQHHIAPVRSIFPSGDQSNSSSQDHTVVPAPSHRLCPTGCYLNKDMCIRHLTKKTYTFFTPS